VIKIRFYLSLLMMLAILEITIIGALVYFVSGVSEISFPVSFFISVFRWVALNFIYRKTSI